jgi:hypothetical protein
MSGTILGDDSVIHPVSDKVLAHFRKNPGCSLAGLGFGLLALGHGIDRLARFDPRGKSRQHGEQHQFRVRSARARAGAGHVLGHHLGSFAGFEYD